MSIVKLIEILAIMVMAFAGVEVEAFAASVGEFTGDSAIAQACRKVQDLVPPGEDVPNLAQIKSLSQCDAGALSDEAQDASPISNAKMIEARYCAYAQKDHAVLTMLYANGYGVVKNLDLAIKFSCDATDDAGVFLMDREWVIQTLIDIRDGTAARRRQEACPPGMDKCTQVVSQSDELFDICDAAARPNSVGWCSIRTESANEVKRTRVLDALARTMTTAQAQAFQNLRQAASILALDRRSEVNTFGSGRATWMINAIAAQRDQFVADLNNCERGDLPKVSPGAAKTADKALNEHYQGVSRQRLMTLPPIPLAIPTSKKATCARQSAIGFATAMPG